MSISTVVFSETWNVAARGIGALCVAGIVGMGLASDASGATITGFGGIANQIATGQLGPVGNVAPNNDNTADPSPNGIPANYFIQQVGVIDIEFLITNSGGTTEYRVTPSFLNVINNQMLTNFQFELGFGVGENFVRSTAADFLDFDMPDGDPAAFSPHFPAVNHQADTLTFTGASIGFIGAAAFAFAIDVPDDLQVFNPYGRNSFSLRMAPNGAPTPAPVPEPTTMVLLGTGLAGLLARGRKRHS